MISKNPLKIAMINPLRRLIEHSFPVFFRNQPFRNFDVIFIVGERPVGAEHEFVVIVHILDLGKPGFQGADIPALLFQKLRNVKFAL